MSGLIGIFILFGICYSIYSVIMRSEYRSLILYSLAILGILVALAIALHHFWKVYKDKKLKLEEQKRSEEELRKHLSLVLSVIDLPSINILGISKEKVVSNPKAVDIIESFKDYVFLEDFDDFSITRSNQPLESYQLKDIMLLPCGFIRKLNAYQNLFIPSKVVDVIENIKLNHMQNRNYQKGQDFLSDKYFNRNRPGKHRGFDRQWDSIRKDVYKRDGYKCVLCGETGKELHAHHIWARAHGGQDRMSNLVTLCIDCHDTYSTLPLHDGLNIYQNGGNSTSDKKAQNRKIISHIFEANHVLIMHYLLRENPLWERKILIDDDCVKRVTLGQLLKNLGLSDND
jgi:5-methylcytosine-specific restriction endonuclease McrA